MQEFGVHSEVGKLRTVMVCRPGLAHQRLTPGNAADLLFDDLLWVQEAQTRPLRLRAEDARARHRGAGTARGAGRDPARQGSSRLGPRPALTVNDVGFGVHALRRPWIDAMPAEQLAEHLIGGVAVMDVPKERWSAMLDRRLWRHRLPAAAGAQHAVPARPLLLDLRRRDRATRCSGRHASRRRCCSARSTSSTRASAAAISRSGGATPTNPLAPPASRAAT